MSGRSETDRIRLRFHRRLTADTVERVLHGASPATKAAEGWTDRAKQEGMFIDLSKVEFAEFSSLAQIALLIEGAVRHGISVVVALPLKKARVGEQRFMNACDESGETSKKSLIKGVQKRIEQRGRSWDFMLHAGFFDAIKVQHVPESHKLVEILTEYDSSSRETDRAVMKEALLQGELPSSQDEKAEAGWQAYYKLSRIYPLRWFEPLDGVQLERSRNFASFVVHCEDLGLATSDARAIAGTILKELVENTCRYAPEPKLPSENKPHALVGMIVLDPEKYRIRPEDMRPCMSDFADWCGEVRSRIIRIVVGDSGNGVSAVLGPHFKSMHDKQIPSFSEDEPLRDTEKILFWSFNKWSTSAPKLSLEKRGTRGLWLVQRFVRIYGGSITMRAEDGMVGWTYQDSEIPTAVRDKRLRYMPGTLLEACLLSENRRRRRGISAERREAEPPSFGLTTLRCHALTDKGFEIRDMSAIASALAEATPTKPTCVLGIIEGVQSNIRATEDVLIDAIHSMENFPNHGALVFLLADVAFEQVMTASESIDLARENLDEEQLQGTDTPLSIEPILLLGPRGDSVWFGEDSTVRTILSLLSETERDDSKGIPFEDLYYGSITADALERFVRDQPDLIQRFGSSAVRLRFTPNQLNRRLHLSFAEQLRDAIYEDGTEAVQVGTFLAPSLVHVNRWIDVTALLDRTTGIGPAAYVLARKVEERLADTGVGPAECSAKLARVDRASAEITNILSECLDLERLSYSVSSGTEAYTGTEAIGLRPGEKVILCADLILTSGTVRRAISELVRMGVHPVAVVCVIDAREEKTDTVRGTPVVSLAEVDITIPPPKKDVPLQYIDPVLRRPMVESPAVKGFPRAYDIEPDEILRWCETGLQSDVLVFGHVVREVGRHFPVYLDAGQLISEYSPGKKDIFAHLVKHVRDWIQKQQGKYEQHTQSVEIWYPGEQDDFAGRIAHDLAEELRKCAAGVDWSRLRGIPRVAFEGRWAFPEKVASFSRPTHVIAVDWGSITRATVHQMMRLAGQAGAVSFKAIVFLSQMPMQDEQSLRRIGAIVSDTVLSSDDFVPVENQTDTLLFNGLAERSLAERVTRQSEPVPAEIIFLSSLRLRFYRPRECPICRLEEAFAAEEAQCPTGLLEAHAHRTARLLEAHERQDYFGKPQADLYGVPLDRAKIVQTVRIRHRLENALGSTPERVCIQNELESLRKNDDWQSKAAWLRVLATEPIWLKLPPLCFENIRETLSKIAQSTITDDSDGHYHNGERQQAIIVLRAASKEDFAVSLPKLLPKCINEVTLVGQLLYDTYTYLRKSYHESSETLQRLRKSLAECRDYIRNNQDSGSHALRCASTVWTLLRATEFLLTKSGTQDRSPKEAWRALREKYRRPLMSPHPFVEKAFDVHFPLTHPVLASDLPTRRDWERALMAWQECLDFLSSNMFPYLQSLRSVFLHDFYARHLGEDIDRLQTLLDESIPFRIGDRLTHMLWEFARNPEGFRDAHKRDESNREWNWWYRLFIRAGGGDEELLNAAKFLRLLEDCPTKVAEAVENTYERVKQKGYPFMLQLYNKLSMEVSVFCDRRLLEEVIAQVFENAVGPKHRTDDATNSEISVFLDVDPNPPVGKFVLRVWNDGTKDTEEVGHGVESVNRQLQAFEGYVNGETLRDGEWTYVARITLERY